MPRPKAYDPQPGYKYQILCRNRSDDRAWEHCEYAVDNSTKNYLIGETRQAYGVGWEFKSIRLPRKYWPSSVEKAEQAQRRTRFAAARPHGMCDRAKGCVEHATNSEIEACRFGKR